MLKSDIFLSYGLHLVWVGGSILLRKGKGKNHLYLYINIYKYKRPKGMEK